MKKHKITTLLILSVVAVFFFSLLSLNAIADACPAPGTLVDNLYTFCTQATGRLTCSGNSIAQEYQIQYFLPTQSCEPDFFNDGTLCEVANDNSDCSPGTCSAGACVAPPVEICDNGVDDDGNGLIDAADPACAPATTCLEDPSVCPAPNVCRYDGACLDLCIANDCGEGICNSFDAPKVCPKQVGVCEGSQQMCTHEFSESQYWNWPGCTDAVYQSNNPLYDPSPQERLCDGLDNNCNNQIDEGCQDSNVLFFKSSSNDNDAVFRACNVNQAQLTSLKNKFQSSDPRQPNPIRNESMCKNLGSWYCDTDSVWRSSTIYSDADIVNSTKNTSVLKKNPSVSGYTPANIFSDNACCPANYCYNGSSLGCEAPYTDPQKPPIGRQYGEVGYRCSSKGNWNLVSLRYDFNQEKTGYCSDDNECYADNKCYKDGEFNVFSGVDRMCIKGNWTTRTKYVASVLMNYANKNGIIDYTLYCDVPERALGLQSILIGTSPFDSINFKVNDSNFNDYVEENKFCGANKCINNVCVLSFNGGVLMGTSLNRPLDDSTHPFYEALGFSKDETTNAVFIEGNETKLVFSSDASGKLFYSNRTQIILYTIDSTGKVPNVDATIGDNILYVLSHPFLSASDFIKGLIFGKTQYTDTINKIADFDKLYVSRKTGILGSKSVIAIQETKFNETEGLKTFIALNYTGFTSDICGAIQKSTALPNSACDNSTGPTYVLDSNTDSAAYDSIWQDLTSKLRIS